MLGATLEERGVMPETAVIGSPETAVIQGKLAVPPLPGRRVERPRLECRLAGLIERTRLLVVSATAGAGKTTAVVGAVGQLERPVAWLTLDATDSAPGRLVTYLEAALGRRLPDVTGTATRALAAGIPHAEAAGLLAEAVGEAPVVLVLDELERLAEARDAWAVIEAVARYAPGGLRLVLISRRAIPTTLWTLRPAAAIAAVGEADLAFTPGEAAEALGQLGHAEIDPTAAVEASGGWVTGVLFEVWRSAGHLAGVGGEADPLHGYLSAHILGELDPEDRDFLVTTSLLDEVSAPRAEALGVAQAAERLAALSAARLPVSWSPDRRVLRCHSRFREYLLELLERRRSDAKRTLRLAYGRLLAAEGRDEDATEEFLNAGAPEAALATAERAILAVIQRLDFAVAARWLDGLAEIAPGPASALTVAEFMLAIGQQDYRRGVRIADQLEALGEREPLARSSGLAAALMGMCYAHACRLDDMHAVLDVAAVDPAVDALRYGIGVLEPGPPPDRPELSGGPLDAIVLATDYFYGRLAELVQDRGSRWLDMIAGARSIGALRVLGRTQRALDLYEAARARGQAMTGLDATVAPEVLIDAGCREEAYEAVARGRAEARAAGSLMFEMCSRIMEAKVALRLERDAGAARAALDRLEREPAARRIAFVREPLDTWYGLALLLQHEDAAALARLRAAVRNMVEADRMLELPTAAVYLAEAEWRGGDEEAADRAADLGLWAARRLGSNHVLLQALASFPAVVSRRIDAEPGPDSPWHELGRALIAQGVAVHARVRASVELREFGGCAIVVNGKEARPRIAKSRELLAYLLTRPGAHAGRDELLDALFDGRTDDSTRAYLRQAIRWLRHVLPEGRALVGQRGSVRLGDDIVVTSESTRFETQLTEAARLQGDERLSATREALAIYDRGDYLPDIASGWAEERRRRLAELATDARTNTAELSFAAGRYDEAERLTDEVLTADPFRETAWRLKMHIANALGDEDRVIRAYRGCEHALARLAATPSPGTRQLIERLRR